MGVTKQELPEYVRDWLFSAELSELEPQFEAFLLDSELQPVHALTMDVYLHNVTIPEFVEKMQKIVPGVRGVELTKSILGYDLLRVKDWFADDIAVELKKLGGDVNDYKVLLDGDEAVDDALRGVNVELIPPRSREAIIAKMLEYLNGSLEKAALLEGMMKSPKIGGWGWDQDTAMPVIEKLEQHLREAEAKHAVFVSKEKFAAIEAKRAANKLLMEEDYKKKSGVRADQTTVAPTAKAAVAAEVPRASVSVEIPDVPDPFAFIVSENLPHLADSELKIGAVPDPFADLLRELENTGVELTPVPQPDYAFANVKEHRGVAEVGADAPRTPFEKALHASDVLLEHELLEIEHQKEEMMKSVPETAIVVSATLEALVDRIMVDSKFTSADTSLTRRIRNIVSSRLRDIRGSEETARLISKIGGGSRDLPREMVETIVMLTEQAFLEFQRKVIERTLQRERSRRVRDREEVLEQKREEVFKNEKELNDRFKKLTGKDMPLELPKPPASGDSSNGSVGKEAAAPVKAPERKVSVMLSSKSAMPAAGTEMVADVKYQRQLAGPIEELRTMRLTDFRRLSKDPKVATEKLHAKLELLGSDSYEKKVQGFVAWRESPVMKLYSAVTKQALEESTPIAAVIEKKRKEIPEMLTLEECQAIRELNTKLRY